MYSIAIIDFSTDIIILSHESSHANPYFSQENADPTYVLAVTLLIGNARDYALRHQYGRFG